MRRPREPLALLGLAAMLGASAAAQEPAPAKNDSFLGSFELGKSKEPITVTSDTLEYDYKKNVAVYHGTVEAAQGPFRLHSDTLTVTLQHDQQQQQQPGDRHNDPPPGDPAEDARVQQIVAVGNVRIERGDRWATGGRAVFDQTARTLVLTESPVLHDGTNEVSGDRVIVYLDENRSEVVGGPKRVKAVLHPKSNDATEAGKADAGKADAAKADAGKATAAKGTPP